MIIKHDLVALFPKLLASGKITADMIEHMSIKLPKDGISFVVMPRYDLDLETALMNHKRKLRLDQVVAIGNQLLDRLEALHLIGYVHGDLKPGNIMCTNNKTGNSLFLIDYGLAVNYQVIQDRKLEFKGTPYFASNNMLMRGNLGPRDDIESLIYMLLYFLQGKLPWSLNLPVMSDDINDHMEL